MPSSFMHRNANGPRRFYVNGINASLVPPLNSPAAHNSVSFNCRNGTMWTWDGTSRITEVCETLEYRRIGYGNPTFLCITGNVNLRYVRNPLYSPRYCSRKRETGIFFNGRCHTNVRYFSSIFITLTDKRRDVRDKAFMFTKTRNFMLMAGSAIQMSDFN